MLTHQETSRVKIIWLSCQGNLLHKEHTAGHREQRRNTCFTAQEERITLRRLLLYSEMYFEFPLLGFLCK